ncbi:hypothetical protein SEA_PAULODIABOLI_299 [Microbacterium phage PauloDiaboli]|nr:hypothetical protein SEA_PAULODIABOLI_299 [Microbacterium phage PauloDiaboli]QWY84106.1 hypothetical protein SEA_A3WALLY_299 [Microbacterium phage A3Wally]
MTYDNRVNKLHKALRDSFRDTPWTSWTILVMALAIIVLTIIFPVPMLTLLAVFGGFVIIGFVLYKCISEL